MRARDAGSVEGSADRGRRRAAIPVRARGHDSVLPKVRTAEAKIAVAQRAVRVHDAAVVVGDVAVVADAARGVAHDVRAEVGEAGVELLKDDGLSLDFADLFADDPLGHLLEHEETLLDDLNGLAMADNFLLLLNDNLLADFTAEVIRAVEVVESGERRDAAPVVERVGVTRGELDSIVNGLGLGQRGSGDTSDDGGKSDDLSKLGEHFERKV